MKTDKEENKNYGIDIIYTIASRKSFVRRAVRYDRGVDEGA